MAKLIGYARVSTKVQESDRQVQDLLAAGVLRDDLSIDHGHARALATRPELTKALNSLEADDALVITTLTDSAAPSGKFSNSQKISAPETSGYAHATSAVAMLIPKPNGRDGLRHHGSIGPNETRN